MITPNPSSRDHTVVEVPDPDPYNGFGLLRSRTPSFEWDNYREDLQFHYEKDWSQSQTRKASTDPNILDTGSLYPLLSVDLDSSEEESSEEEMMNTAGLNSEVSRLQTLKGNLLRRINMLTADDVTEDLVHEVDNELKIIHDMMDDYVNGVEYLLVRASDNLNQTQSNRYREDITYVISEVKKHKQLVQRKKKDLLPPPATLTAYEEKMLELQMEQLKLQKAVTSKAAEDKANKGILLAETKANQFFGETNVMGDLLMEENWEETDNSTVSQAMRLINSWQNQMNQVERTYREFENDAKEYSFPQDKVEPIDAEYTRIREKFDNIKKAVQFQDRERGLFTMEPTKTEKVTFPTFSGKPSEDYMKWKQKTEIAFLKNRVPRDERVEKLREYLKGKALLLVPDTTKSIDCAYAVLQDAFGDPARVLEHKIASMDDLGSFPTDKLGKGLPGYGKQVDWFLRIEAIVKDIIELGEEYPELDRDAFSTATLKRILERFPEKIVAKFNRIKGDGKVRLEKFLKLIGEKRVEAQGLDNTYINLKHKQNGVGRGAGPGGGGGHGTATGDGAVGGKTGQYSDLGRYDASVFFKEPETFEDCRVCHSLSTEGITNNLFSNHLSNYVTGCPNFIRMSAEKRKAISIKSKFCMRCFHPDLVWTKDHDKECVFATGKRRNAYSCKNLSCKEHMWLCTTHRAQNKKAMDKFKLELSKRGLQLSYGVKVPLLKVGQHQGNQCGPVQPDPVAGALKKLKRSLKNSTIVDVPDGEPMFMFFGAKGKTRSLTTFLDNGCSHAVFRKDVPGAELKGQLIQNGPFDIGGVGGARVIAHSEWICSMDREDGRKQLVQGLTVDKVTSDFPMIDISTAVREVQSSDPTNAALQACKLPPSVGGSVDILLGIMYSSIFPDPIHCLDSGLTIYRTKLSPYHKAHNAIIGGPHSSFQFLADRAGNPAALLSHFMQGLKTFREWDGAPKIRDFYITNTLAGVEEKYLEFQNMQCSDVATNKCSDAETNEIEGGSVPLDSREYFFSENVGGRTAATAADERISSYKKKFAQQETGLEIDYRCVRCRDCPQCKNADRTEKISLREEAEMVEIRNSVKLDFEKKEIVCSLPLRGKEEDFLSSNRNKALKVLDQQCSKYYEDVETRETIVAAFNKLIDRGHAVKLDELSEELKSEFLGKPVQYHIPWRVVFKISPTTPTRPVLDASSGTAKRADGTGGRCLNDLVCKGKVETLHLINMLLRFKVGRHAITGDLTQFYNSCKLKPNQWNLQRFLFREDLNPDSEILEFVITTLIYGVKCVSAQTEHAIALLADHIKENYPELANFLIRSRYCDDMGDSRAVKEELYQLAADADLNFAKVGLKCKVWTMSETSPSEEASVDGVTVNVGGINWFPEVDAIETKIPLLHFSKKRRGRLPENTKFFDGKVMNIEDFVPKKLTRTHVTSKLASVFDFMGHLAPMLSGLKSDLREVVQHTIGWKDSMPDFLRNKWLKNFLKLETLRGLKFHRPIMPADAIDTKMRLFIGADAAKENMMIGAWGSFKRRDGSWSCQFLLGRSVLADTNSTIPKNELQALTGGSNLGWVIRRALPEWVDKTIVFSDSVIALCWITSEKKQLGIFHRNRVIQVRRGTNLDDLYHCRTDQNPSDVGTRPNKVTPADVGPESRWNNGDEWMKSDLSQAIKVGTIKPASELRLTKDMEEDYSEGFLIEKQPDVLTRGHIANETRIRKLEERATFSEYILNPTKFNFTSTVRILGYVMSFVIKSRRGRKTLGRLLMEGSLTFSVFNSNNVKTGIGQPTLLVVSANKSSRQTDERSSSLVSYFTRSQWADEERDFFARVHAGNTDAEDWVLDDRFLNLALLYLYRKAALEVQQFHIKEFVKKVGILKEGILLSHDRLVDSQNFSQTSELEFVKLGSLGIKPFVPVIDRFSPLAYSISQHVHWEVAKHRGVETCNRMCLEHVKIIQAVTLFKELSAECIVCRKRRKKFLQVQMGPISNHQLQIAPCFWACQMDLFGPLMVTVPGFERHTRNRQVLEAKVWVMTTVCMTTRVVNLQVIEKDDTGGIVQGLTRLACEVGFPKIIFCDKDPPVLSAMRHSQTEFRDLQYQLHRQHGIEFETCPVSGHNMHGTVERIIRSIQESMEECNFKKLILHATSLQTMLKVIENQYNNLPLGYHYHQDQDNTPLLKIITPNMLRVGRINSRSLDGPVRLPNKFKEQLKAVENAYDAWFKVWKESYLPKLIFQPKWFKTDQDLREGDLVYFMKSESKLSNEYTMGKVDQVIAGRDGIARRIIIKYFNPNESEPKFSDRAVRSVIKIFSIDEFCLAEDLAILQKRIDKKFGKQENDDQSELDETKDLSEGTKDSIAEPPAVETVVSAVMDLSSTELWASLSIQMQNNPRSLILEHMILSHFPSACSLKAEAMLFMSVMNTDTEVSQLYTNSEVEQGNMDKLTQLIMSVNMLLD